MLGQKLDPQRWELFSNRIAKEGVSGCGRESWRAEEGERDRDEGGREGGRDGEGMKEFILSSPPSLALSFSLFFPSQQLRNPDAGKFEKTDPTNVCSRGQAVKMVCPGGWGGWVT